MDYRREAVEIVVRAFKESIPDLLEKHKDPSDLALKAIFGDRKKLDSFFELLDSLFRQVLFHHDSRYQALFISPVVEGRNSELLTVNQIIDIVQVQLKTYVAIDFSILNRLPYVESAPGQGGMARPQEKRRHLKENQPTEPAAPAGAHEPQPPSPSLRAPSLQPPSQPAPMPPVRSPQPPSPYELTVSFEAPNASATNASLMRVFYGTDRMEILNKDGRPQYGHIHSDLGQISYGVCAISIPKTHKLGKLETPSILKLEFRPDPEKHIVLQHIKSLTEATFLEGVKASVAASATKEAFIFIHGYKVSFEDAARRTGQIAFDLHFVGAPIFYSWPSYGKFADYAKDESNVIWSAPHFQRFVGLIAQHSGAKRTHIIAHSMGNRAVCDALKALSIDPSTNFKLNHLVLAAADIDADTFRELAANLQQVSVRITLYESSKDKALLASKKRHGNPRAGEPLLLVPGLDTIDASNIDTDFLGHSYFSDNWPLLSDIYSVLQKDDIPAARFGLMEMDSKHGKYYAFKA